MTCSVCLWQPARKLGRCETCWRYLWRNGRDRPEELIVRHGRRVMEREKAV